MKKFLIGLSVLTALSLFGANEAKEAKNEIEKKGFFTTAWCAKNGYFADCRLESVVCGEGGCYKHWNFGDKIKEELVLYVHDDLKTYKIKLDGIPRYELDEAINRNEVTFIGELKGDTIIAHEFKAPPPPKKSFFKGCL